MPIQPVFETASKHCPYVKRTPASNTSGILLCSIRFAGRLSLRRMIKGGRILYMDSLILAGGKGTRLRPLTIHTPKPVVPIANRPFLLYQVDLLTRAGISDITL